MVEDSSMLQCTVGVGTSKQLFASPSPCSALESVNALES